MADSFYQKPTKHRHVRFVAEPEALTDGSVVPSGVSVGIEEDFSGTCNIKQKDAEITLSCLEEVLQKDDENQCRHLAESPETLSVCEEKGVTLIYLAARWGAMKVLHWLITTHRDLDVRTQDYMACTPLHCAIQYGRLEAVKMLITNGANCLSLNSFGDGAVYVSVYYQQERVLEWLIEHGLDVNLASNTEDSPLLCAARHGNQCLMSILISHGADMYYQGPGGIAVMDLVLRHQQCCKLLKPLLAAKYDLSHEWDQQRPSPPFLTLTTFPLVYAVGHPDICILRLLLEHGCHMDQIHRAMIEAVYRSNVPAFHLLAQHLSTRANPDMLNGVLMLAIKEGQVGIVRSILGLKLINLNEDSYVEKVIRSQPVSHLQPSGMLLLGGLNKYRMSRPKDLIPPAQYLASVHQRCRYIIDELLSAGADINQPSDYGESPLFAACVGGFLCLAWHILLRGAEVHLTNKHNKTPLALCIHLSQRADRIKCHPSLYRDLAKLLFVFMVGVWSEPVLLTVTKLPDFETMFEGLDTLDQPLSLQHQCRRKILLCLAQPPLLPTNLRVDELGLPPRLRDYLCLGGDLWHLFETEGVLLPEYEHVSSGSSSLGYISNEDFHVVDAKFSQVAQCGCLKLIST